MLQATAKAALEHDVRNPGSHMSIEQEIMAWDGKSADDIRVVYKAYREQPGFADTIINLTDDEHYQKGATWLLKAWLESGNKLKKSQIAKIYGLLNKLRHWEAKLHLLQCIPFMPIETTDRKSIDTFLRATLTDANKFVRAWSYNGFYELAAQHPEYKEEVKKFFEMAMRVEAPSVKARIRIIMKKGF